MFNWDMLIPLAGMATTVVLLFPIVKAGVRYLERRSGGHPMSNEVAGLREEVRALQERLESADMAARVAELEERVDFAERMLARHREGQVGSGN
ncbi:MAG: hypothetical protein AMS18_15955 [Gemmatimonas sp. SG8_17]|nr:MAG: hypothetical protein AMS18_15955 [Gemmatimonas sp. SG8_17]